VPVLETSPTPRNQYSFSRVKTYFQCPLRYRYRYLKGFKELFRSVESHLGSAVHDVLEWLYAERAASRTPTLGAALEVLAARWGQGLDDEVAVVRCSDDAGAYLRAAREMVAGFFHGAFQRDRSETVALEQRLSLRLSDDVVFTGFADRIGRTEVGRLFVIDYKTSRSAGNPSEFSEGLQAPLYAACAMLERGETEALAGYHYLRLDTTSWQSVDAERGRQLLARFAELVREVSAATDFEPRPGVLCAWCGFNAVCPSAQVPESLSGGLGRAREILDRSPSLYAP
jgi:putative RecB family exonuclease